MQFVYIYMYTHIHVYKRNITIVDIADHDYYHT